MKGREYEKTALPMLLCVIVQWGMLLYLAWRIVNTAVSFLTSFLTLSVLSSGMTHGWHFATSQKIKGKFHHRSIFCVEPSVGLKALVWAAESKLATATVRHEGANYKAFRVNTCRLVFKTQRKSLWWSIPLKDHTELIISVFPQVRPREENILMTERRKISRERMVE